MHVVMFTAIGLIALIVFVLAATLFNRGRTENTINGAYIFAGVWFIAALVNGYNGWAHHGIPLVNEVAAFIPIFGIPAAAAWLWSRRMRAAEKQ